PPLRALSLHDALPISASPMPLRCRVRQPSSSRLMPKVAFSSKTNPRQDISQEWAQAIHPPFCEGTRLTATRLFPIMKQYKDARSDRKSTRLNSSHVKI